MTSSEGRFALRISDPLRIHEPGSEDIEAGWLRLLDRDQIPAPVNVPTLDHHSWSVSGMPSVEGERICSLFTWVPGRPVSQKLSSEIMSECGALLAQLHDHAALVTHEIPNVEILSARNAVYLPVDNRVLHYESQFGSLLVEAYGRAQGIIDSLWQVPPHQPHLIHGDFGPQNVVTWIKQHYPIDFQDLQYGFDLQDVAVTIADLKRNNPELVKPFIAGYSEVRPWPDLSPEIEKGLAIARSLNLMNLGLHRYRPGLGEYLEAHCRRIRRWMER